MRGLDGFDGNEDGIVFRDVIMLALLDFVTIVILLLPHLNPPVKTAEAMQPPGNVVVEVRWPDGLVADIDLWVEVPGDAPVGYSNQCGRFLNLLRDDLGQAGNDAELYCEVAYSRGIPAGDYTVNLHLYRDTSRRLPLAASVVISVKHCPDDPVRKMASETIELLRVGQEITVARFTLDEEGTMVPGSLHRLPRELRTARR